MCTITFTPISNHGFILTSNRDEAPGRETLPPEIYNEDGVKLLYPKDAVAGGTWIGVSDRKRVASLMNGGFVAHEPKQSYRKSRGVVLKDILRSNDLKSEIEQYNFQDIEPFTVILVDWNDGVRLFKLVWDGEKYHFSEEPLAPQIWSSSPLYPEVLKKKREKWFSEFLFETIRPTEDELLNFHKTSGDGDLKSSLVMDREYVKTKSITQIVRNNDAISMRYEDLQTDKVSKTAF
ncbi:NRDE family protein [Aequorivita sp. KMM 9714]|uniref:NRDE family protein n=1 Tax=Aequorivita sp. KMM 9714 TaxID=2707173 RepID=UPI0013EB81FA|nr:NRDE family protein [Aequorivita sp. KMM 9714]NGX83665.1 NRDE family protein [Aequorivita sp. KMM 9714]